MKNIYKKYTMLMAIIALILLLSFCYRYFFVTATGFDNSLQYMKETFVVGEQIDSHILLGLDNQVASGHYWQIRSGSDGVLSIFDHTADKAILKSDGELTHITTPLRLSGDELPDDMGAMNFDASNSVMNIRNSFSGSSLQVGQEQYTFVVNRTGEDIAEGALVKYAGYDSEYNALIIELSLADSIDNADVDGIVTTPIMNGESGLVTTFGRVNDLNTIAQGAFFGAPVYLSMTEPGTRTTIKPNIPIQVGHIGIVDDETGWIHVDIRTGAPLVYGSFSSSEDQFFDKGMTSSITFDSNNQVSGITHIMTDKGSVFEFPNSGVYETTIEAQVELYMDPTYQKDMGFVDGGETFNIFTVKDSGAGPMILPNSNMKITVPGIGKSIVSTLTTVFAVERGDRVMFKAHIENENMYLNAYPASGTEPNNLPATPSIVLNMVRIGD